MYGFQKTAKDPKSKFYLLTTNFYITAVYTFLNF